MIAPFGLIAALLTAITGDTSAYNVAQKQPMKLAAMEALYEAGPSTENGKVASGKGLSLSIFGLIDTSKLEPLQADNADNFHFNIAFPSLLSWLGTHSFDGYVPGINNILRGDYYMPDGSKALSAEEKMERGKLAVTSLELYHKAKKEGNKAEMDLHKKAVMDNFSYFGYGHLKNAKELVPNVPVNYYAFRVMVGCGVLFILVFLLSVIFSRKKERFMQARWLHVVMIICLPLVYLASQSGWIVAELGRQPWTIQDMLPVNAAVSALEAGSVITTFVLFAVLFTVLLVAEISIMVKSIKEGPKEEHPSSVEK